MRIQKVSGQVVTEVDLSPQEEAAWLQEEAAVAQAQAIQTAKRNGIAQAKADAKADTFVQQFVEMTPAQVVAYVNSNVSTLADAKQLLTKLALMMLALAKEQYK